MDPIHYIEPPQANNPQQPTPTYIYAGMAVPVVMLLLCIGCTWEGAASNNKPMIKPEVIVPTAQETRLLNAFGMSPTSPMGQNKIRKFRDQQKKLAAARERILGMRERAERTRRPSRQVVNGGGGIETLLFSLQTGPMETGNGT